MTKTLSYKDYANIKNNRKQLKDLRDDAAINAWEVINTLDLAFKPIQDQVDNIMQQIEDLNNSIQRRKTEVEKEFKGESEEVLEKAKDDAVKELNTEMNPKLQELQQELSALRKKERKVEFKPLTKAELKEHGLLNFGVLDTFSAIIEGSDKATTHEESDKGAKSQSDKVETD